MIRFLAILILGLGLIAAPGCSKKKPSGNTAVAGSFETVAISEHEATTGDGWKIALHRYQSVYGQRHRYPVLLSTGFLSSSALFDLYNHHSLAKYLADRGFDVWSYDIRGTGASQSPDVSLGGLLSWDYSIDDFVYHDTPAAVQYVLNKTGSDQFLWVSHSMGSLMAYAYLESENASRCRGLVSVGGIGILNKEQNLEFFFSRLFLGFGMSISKYIPPNLPIPLRWTLDKILGENLKAWSAVSYLLDTPGGRLLWNELNLNPTAIYEILRRVLSNTSSNVFRQFFDWVEKGDCTVRRGSSANRPTFTVTIGGNGNGAANAPGAGNQPVNADAGNEEGGIQLNGEFGPFVLGNRETRPGYDQPYSITKNLHKITTPLFLLSGAADGMAPPGNVQFVFDQVGSTDKTYQNITVLDGALSDYGHLDLLVGERAPDEVYPLIGKWLEEKAGNGR